MHIPTNLTKAVCFFHHGSIDLVIFWCPANTWASRRIWLSMWWIMLGGNSNDSLSISPGRFDKLLGCIKVVGGRLTHSTGASRRE